MNKLKSLYIEITSKCNMNCPYCYNDSSSKGIFLDKDKVFNLINQCKLNKISEITISGGEPFLHPNIIDFIEYANSKQIKVRIISNLSVVSFEDSVKILKNGNFFQLTLDSTNEKENDSIRGIGCYQKIVKLLQYAKNNKLSKRISLRMNLGKNNVHRIQSFIDFAISFGIKHISIAFIANCGRGYEYEYAFNYKDSLPEMVSIMENLKMLSNKFDNIIDISYNNLEKQRSCPLFCRGDLEINPRVSPNGDVFFCSYFFDERNSIGNIYKNTIMQIINSKELENFRQTIQQRKNNEKCNVCAFKRMCSGGCPAISFMNTKDILDISTQCKMIKYFIKNEIKQKRGL